MGICIYCKNPAGFLRKKHMECQKKFIAGNNEIKELIKSSASTNSNIKELKSKINEIASNSYIAEPELKNIIYEGWKLAIEQAFEDGVLSKQEEDKLGDIIENFEFNKNSLNTDPAYMKLVKGAILRDILEGKIPERVSISGNLPFNFQKSEKIIWVFQNVKYYEMRTYKQYVGGYQGASIRIAKGLYYKVGSFRGNPVETNKMIQIDTGTLAITDSYIYFGGPLKSFRIKYDKIVTFEPYSDGLGIQRDAQTAKPQIFVTGDGWFTSNLIMNIAKM